jgi:hypothetical protein
VVKLRISGTLGKKNSKNEIQIYKPKYSPSDFLNICHGQTLVKPRIYGTLGKLRIYMIELTTSQDKKNLYIPKNSQNN